MTPTTSWSRLRISLLLPRVWVRLSNFDVGQLRRIGQIAPVETLQPQYNEPQLSRNLELVVRLAAVADRHDTTPARSRSPGRCAIRRSTARSSGSAAPTR